MKKQLRTEIINIIYNKVSKEMNVNPTDIKKRRRKREVVMPRQLVQYFLKEYTDLSLNKIGKKTGGYSHSTVLASTKTIKQLYETDKNFRQQFNKIKNYIDRKIAQYPNRINSISLIKDFKKDLTINQRVELNNILANI